MPNYDDFDPDYSPGDDEPLTDRERAVMLSLITYALCAAIGLTWLLIQISRQVINHPWLLIPIAVGLAFLAIRAGARRPR